MLSTSHISGLVLSLALLSGPKAICQVDLTGSIVLIEVSKNTITIAADSRGVYSVHGQRTEARDDDCKIAILGGEVIFAASGHVARRADGADQGWSAFEIASATYKEMKSSSGVPPNAEAVAEEWQRRIGDRISESRDPFDAIDGNILLAGVFAGRKANSELEVTVAVLYREGYQMRGELINLDDRQRLQAIGVTGVFDEFVAARTPRAQQWHRMLDPLTATERLSGLIRLTEKYSDTSVGGPVDIVELTRNGSRWLQRKASCPAKSN